MSFLAVVFVVLMVIGLVIGGAGYNFRENPNGPIFVFGNFFLLWLCVAILGYIVLGGGSNTPMR